MAAEVQARALLGDASKAKNKLGWTPKITFDELVSEMVREDLKEAERDELVKKHGYQPNIHARGKDRRRGAVSRRCRRG